MNKKTIAGLIGSALLLVGTQAHAEISWTFSSGISADALGTLGNTISRATDGVTASARAWSNTNNGSGTVGKNGYDNSGGVSTSEVSTINGYTLETAYLNIYGGAGLGVKNQDANYQSNSQAYQVAGDFSEGNSPEHSVDNDQRYDSVLFSFSSAVDLNSVSLGWYNNDSDISVLRYDGAGDASNVAGKTYAQLLALGWSLVSQNAALSTASKKILDGAAASSYWLIGAANPLLGTSMDSKNDYVKLLALAGDKYVPPCTPGTPGCGSSTSVPEPGTLLLMGAGLFGLSRFNARRPLRFAA